MRILFQGDSITDAGRNREEFHNLGGGYPMFAAARLNVICPCNDFEFINCGISGDRSIDLLNRWDDDCLGLKPDVVSVLIGINDTWRRYDSNDPTTAGDYEANYRNILSRIKEKLPDTRIIILEPFVLPTPADRLEWREDLDPKIAAARKLAAEFKTGYVPLDGIFNKYAIISEPEKWAADGVHPTPAGHALIADEWINEFQNVI
jgi:lysophospholipase L1-like esterase